MISIHAPRAGSDTALNSLRIPWRLFQSTLPVRGATLTNDTATEAAVLFQSTLPVRGATSFRPVTCHRILYFNPRSPCGERPIYDDLTAKYSRFQSTLPVRGATGRLPLLQADDPEISIHAPRAGSDLQGGAADWKQRDFNPRSPCGERLCPNCGARMDKKISIHAPRAGSDRRALENLRVGIISIHAPRAGSDVIFSPSSSSRCYFNPRPPCGGRLVYLLIILID